METSPTGKAYEYRFVELPSSDASTEELNTNSAPEGYKVSYSVGGVNTYAATNKLVTRDVTANKTWVNSDQGNSVKLHVMYKAKDSNYYEVQNSTVTLDGTPNANPASSSNAVSAGESTFGYEDAAWHAKWTLPVILPSDLWSNGQEPDSVEGTTDYKIEEINAPDTYGSRQFNDTSASDSDTETQIQNMKLVKLNLLKTWRANSNAKKAITVDIYRIAGTDSIPQTDTYSEEVGTVTLNQANGWKWSGYSLNSSGTTMYFDKYKVDQSGSSATTQEYLYYAREVKVGDTDTWTDRKLTTNDGKRYEVKTQTLAFTGDTEDAASAVTSTDERSAEFTNFQLRDIKISKIWNDNSNAYNTRPDKLTIALYRTTEKVQTDSSGNITSRNTWTRVGETVELSNSNAVPADSNKWEHTWTDLPYYDENASLYTYKVEEIVPQVNSSGASSHASDAVYVCGGVSGDGDATASTIIANGGTDAGNAELVNTLTKKVSVSGIKYWADGGNKRPDDITLTLKRTTEPVTDASSWNAISYTVGSSSVFSTVTRFVSGLFSGSSASTEGPELKWTKSGNQWTYTFLNLDGYDNDGKRYIYKVEENAVPDGYRNEVLEDSDSSGLPDLVNVRQTNLNIEKKWYKTDDVNSESVIVKIYRTTDDEIPENTSSDGTGSSEYLGKVTLDANNSWNWSGTYLDSDAAVSGEMTYFDSFKVYDSEGKPENNPQKYLYYAREYQADTATASDGYITVDSKIFEITEKGSYTLTATPGQLDSGSAVIINRQLTDLELTKTWIDDNNAYKTRPEDLKVKLSRSVQDGDREELTDATPTIVKDSGNKWTFTWKNMPMYDMDGNIYTYYAEEIVPVVKEDSLLPGSSYICLEAQSTVKFDENGKSDLTNLLKKQSDLTGQKTWSDGDGTIRPDKIELTLYRRLSGKTDWEKIEDTEPIWYKQSDGTWNFIYENILQTDEDGVRYYYKVEETVPDGYLVYYSKDDDGNELILKNVADGRLTVSKEVKGSGGNKKKEFHFTIEVGKLPDGSMLPDGIYGEITFTDGKAEITLISGESMTATGLPGGITYVVKETEANTGGYRTTSENDEGMIEPNGLSEVKFINTRPGSGNGGNGGSSGGGDKNPNGNIPTGPAIDILKPTDPVEPTEPINPDPSETQDPGSVLNADRDKRGNGEYDEEGNVYSANRGRKVAKTGDESKLARDVIEMFVAGVAIVFLILFKKKKKEEDEEQ